MSRGRRALIGAITLLAVMPLLVPAVWSGFRLGLSDPILSVIASSEQPLSVRSPGGIWAGCLALAWFSLAYVHRRFAIWEPVLVVLGGAVALARAGNTWFDAAAMLAPLAHQLVVTRPRTWVLGVAGLLSLGVGLATFDMARPPALAAAAIQAARMPADPGSILADWRWATQLQEAFGQQRTVLAAGGLSSEPADFWVKYLQVAQGHEHWPAILAQLHVDVVVLDAADQQRQAAIQVRASPDWQVIYDADGALVAQHRGST